MHEIYPRCRWLVVYLKTEIATPPPHLYVVGKSAPPPSYSSIGIESVNLYWSGFWSLVGLREFTVLYWILLCYILGILVVQS